MMPVTRSASSLSLVGAALLGALACANKDPAPTTNTNPPPPSEIPQKPEQPVTNPPLGPAQTTLPPAISGGTLLVLRDGSAAVASDPDRDLISVVDLGTRALRGQITLAPGSEPGRAVEDSAGRVHVVLRGAGAVVTIDSRDAKVIGRRTPCAAPRGVAFDSDKQLLHVACAGGELVSLPAMGDTATRTLHLDRDLRDVLVRGNKLLVSSFRAADLLTVGDTGVDARTRPAAARAAINVFGEKPIMGLPTNGTSVGDMNATAAVAWRLVPGPGTTALVLHQRGLDTEVGTQPNAYGSGPSCAGIVESAVSSYDDGGGVIASVRSGNALGSAVLAVDLALSPDGKQLAVVAAGNANTDQQVLFYSTETATTPAPERPCVPGSSIPGPTPPRPDADGGVAGTPDAGADGGEGSDDGAPIEYRPPNGQIIAVAYDHRGNLIVQSREPATLQILTQRTAPIVLSTQRRTDQGHSLFHSATAGKLACASCHPEGGDDGRTWRFAGLGARRTQSLRGGIMDTAPFHWNGDMPSIDHLMHDVFEGRMSGAKVERPQLQALSQWVDQIKPIKLSSWHEAGTVARGKSLFETTGACATCHRGPDLTNGASFDVGTGGTFQVPQLHNLAFRAPFMHDGCASTLRERFTKCGGTDDRHGLTSKLSAAQIDDLVAYLETL